MRFCVLQPLTEVKKDDITASQKLRQSILIALCCLVAESLV